MEEDPSTEDAGQAEDGEESGRTSLESADEELSAYMQSLDLYQASSTTGPAPATEDSDFELAT
jgi:hypothetical protein